MASKTEEKEVEIEFDDGVFIQADNEFIPAQHFQGVKIAKGTESGAEKGFLVFEFLFQGGKRVITEEANNHNRKQKLARVQRQYSAGINLVQGNGKCKK